MSEALLALHARGEISDAALEALLSQSNAERDRLRAALKFYADAWTFTTNKRYGGLEWKPTETLLDDCGNLAKEALK